MLLFIHEISNAIYRMQKIQCEESRVKFHTYEISQVINMPHEILHVKLRLFTCEISNVELRLFTCEISHNIHEISHVKNLLHGKHMGYGIHMFFETSRVNHM